jgi:hypothetical protein
MNAMSYAYTTLAGYLRRRHDHDFVMILIGDHQPPALVSGEGASWDVPVHVITNRTAILDRLKADGFRDGLTPVRPDLGRMQTLLPMLLDAFGRPAANASYMPPSSADGPYIDGTATSFMRR